MEDGQIWGYISCTNLPGEIAFVGPLVAPLAWVRGGKKTRLGPGLVSVKVDFEIRWVMGATRNAIISILLIPYVHFSSILA